MEASRTVTSGPGPFRQVTPLLVSRPQTQTMTVSNLSLPDEANDLLVRLAECYSAMHQRQVQLTVQGQIFFGVGSKSESPYLFFFFFFFSVSYLPEEKSQVTRERNYYRMRYMEALGNLEATHQSLELARIGLLEYPGRDAL